MCHVSHVTCRMPCVTYHVSHVTCHMSNVTCEEKKEDKNVIKWWSQSVEGLLSTGPTPSSFLIGHFYLANKFGAQTQQQISPSFLAMHFQIIYLSCRPGQFTEMVCNTKKILIIITFFFFFVCCMDSTLSSWKVFDFVLTSTDFSMIYHISTKYIRVEKLIG